MIPGMSVHALVQQVIVDTKAKLEEQEQTKTASAKPTVDQSAGSQSGQQGVEDFLKVADACDHLAKHIHLVIGRERKSIHWTL